MFHIVVEQMNKLVLFFSDDYEKNLKTTLVGLFQRMFPLNCSELPVAKVSISDWIQFIGAIAIVAGLILVMYELQQSRDMTGDGLLAQQFDVISDRYNTLMGENPSATLY